MKRLRGLVLLCVGMRFVFEGAREGFLWIGFGGGWVVVGGLGGVGGV